MEVKTYTKNEIDEAIERAWEDAKEIEYEGYKIYAIPYDSEDMDNENIFHISWIANVDCPPVFINEEWGYQSISSWSSFESGDSYHTYHKAIEAGKQAIQDGKVK